MAHLHPIIFISSESSFQALQSNRTNFQHIYNSKVNGDKHFWINCNKSERWFHDFCVFGKNHAKIFLCVKNVSVNFVLYCQSFLNGFGFKSMCFFLIFTMW